jgi:glycosyltransferase involved in cell wall biosynthesis
LKKLKLVYVGNKLSSHGFTPTSVELLGERLRQDFDIVTASSKKNQLLRLFHIWWVILMNRKADYLLIDTYSTSAFMFAWTSAKLAKELGLKYIPILHGGDLPKKAKEAPAKLKTLLQSAHEVVCPSTYLKVEMEKLYKRPYHIIPNFIDINDYKFLERDLSHHKEIRMLWVRSFHAIYNPELAIRVLKNLTDRGYPANLCMVGPDKDGSLAKVKSLALELDVLHSLKIMGRLSKAEWIELSKDFNIFINTTNIDNAPVSVIEALALGLPLVSTNVGGLPYLLNHGRNAILVEPDNVISFSDAIISLVQADSKGMSIEGRGLAEQWDWPTVRNLWKELLTGRSQ